MPAFLESVTDAWSSYYGNHQVVSVTIVYFHLASTVVGGGAAITWDWLVIKALRRDAAARRSVLGYLRGAHAVVVPALVGVVVSGLAMTVADLDTYLTSRLFWAKGAFVAVLLVNGGLLIAAESAVATGDDSSWGRLSAFSAASIALWLVTTLVGTWLKVAA